MGTDIEHLRQWIGNSVTTEDTVTPGPVASLRATLDLDGAVPGVGEPLPPLWHWLYFLEHTRQSELADNGHASHAEFLPPVTLMQRMYAGNALQFHHPVCIGDAISRTSTITDVQAKQGSQGALVFVGVQHEIRNAQGLAITEDLDIVYLDPVADGQERLVRYPDEKAGEEAWSQEFVTDSMLLFRYSALTFNSHRIHYDLAYATQVEGYPGLVVHGPLQATLLLQLLQANQAGAYVQSFRFRALHPVFNEQPFVLNAKPDLDERHIQMWVTDQRGALCMQAEAQIANWH